MFIRHYSIFDDMVAIEWYGNKIFCHVPKIAESYQEMTKSQWLLNMILSLIYEHQRNFYFLLVLTIRTQCMFVIRKGCSYLLIDLAINLSPTYDNIEARVEEYNYSWFVEHVEMVFSGFQKNNNNLNITTNRKSVAVKSYTS